jgi:hypothetical protein
MSSRAPAGTSRRSAGRKSPLILGSFGARFGNPNRRWGILAPKGSVFWTARVEVRLPQGLRFTDVRRSAIGDNAVARRGSRASKSCGCFGLYPPSCILLSLRFPSAAAFLRANLRSVLDFDSGFGGFCLHALRRLAGWTPGFSNFNFNTVPGLPAGAAALRARGGLRTLPGPHERRGSCPQI